MSEFSVTGDELKKLLKISKKGELPFAYCPGKSTETDLFALHRKKPPAMMAKALKAEGDGNKVAFGTAKMDGKIVYLQCEKVVPSLAKKVKKFLKLQKVKRNVVITDADGAILEQDIEDLPDDPSDDMNDAPADGPQSLDAARALETLKDEGPDQAALMEQAKALRPKVTELEGPVGEKLRKIFAAAIASLKKQDGAGALKAFDTIEAALTRIGGAAKPEPVKEATPSKPDAPKPADAATLKKLQDAAAQMTQRIKALPNGDARVALAELLRGVLGHIKAANPEAAMAGLRDIQKTLKLAEAKPAEQAATGPDPLEIWRAAKEASDAAISALQAKIKSYPVAHPDLARIAEFGLNGITQGNQAMLMAKLLDFKSSTGPDKSKAAAALQKQADQYRAFLASSEMISLCETNPFGVSVNLRGPLTKALDTIAKATAAAV